MQWKKKREQDLIQSNERQVLIADIRKAELEWKLAEWRFHHALGDDHVDYAIYCLEAAEMKLGILLKQAKLQWKHSAVYKEDGVSV
ncbi:DUF2508 family protein [Cohnella sp. WQ 127256]|uniref:DUF2508 family protein n=1 Tax=Cohnella sp. WQ 127256 TaxID=2938790 RepID=UPI002118F3DF|nr:DUF2508 family protein [Cohnella sp. WQ 127256]